ncbi:MAG: Cna B-type domain-containing protein [Oscillospiraceae bacterium]|nr:Cna B-type domain-containing protein [Oscillospiraceae bacterium]
MAVSFLIEDEYISDVTFNVYRVADENYQPVGAYTAYSVVLEDLLPDEFGPAATALAAFTVRDGIPADFSDITNEYGYVQFDGLQTGIYLVMGEMFTDGNTVYNPLPFLAMLPSYDTNGNAIYDITASPKYDMWQTDKKLERSVKKVWVEGNFENIRPAEITAQLLQNGSIADEVVLNEANGWSYSWSDLDPNFLWLVIEKTVPNDYAVSVEQQGTIFTVTNAYMITSGGHREPGNDTPPTLPNTGQLWWPVPILLFAGAVMLLIGVSLSRKSGKDA